MEQESYALKIPLTDEEQKDLARRAVERNSGNAPTAKQVIQVIETEFEEKKPKDYRTVPTHKDMIRVVKAWLSLRFPKFDDALSELKELCIPWMLKEPHRSILLDLIKHVEHLYIIDHKRFNVRDACKAALKDWESLDPEELKNLYPKEEIEPEAEQKPESEPELTHTQENVLAGDYVCCFCGGRYPRDQLFWGNDDVTICRKCASKAQIALLHPDDPEVIAECQQKEHDLALWNSDRDKIMRFGTRLYYRWCYWMTQHIV